jgi:hypothetical protein
MHGYAMPSGTRGTKYRGVLTCSVSSDRVARREIVELGTE